MLFFPVTICIFLFSETQSLTYNFGGGITDLTSLGVPQPTEATELILSGNLLTILPSGYFDTWGWLKILDVRSNCISFIEDDTFIGLGNNLTHLYLQNNCLESINSSNFDHLAFLQELWLSNNKIRTIEQGSFHYLYAIEKISLADNQITVLDDEFIFGGQLGLHWNVVKVKTRLPKFLLSASSSKSRAWQINKINNGSIRINRKM